MKERCRRILIECAFLLSLALPNAGWAQISYTVEQITTGAVNHRAPSINNLGEIAWMAETAQGWQVFSSTRGQLTSPNSPYTEAREPSLADDGSFLCFRPGSPLCNPSAGHLLRYPGESTVLACSRNDMSGAHVDPVVQTGMSSNGRMIWGREFYSSPATLSSRRFFLDGIQVSPGTLVNWNNPSVNQSGEYVYDLSGEIYSSARGSLLSGTDPSINDKGEVAYVSGGEVRVLCRSTDIVTIVGSGSSPSLNSSGAVVFERLVGANYQIFRATPPPCLTCVNWLYQCDPPWGDDHYDNLYDEQTGQPLSICAMGCALTCLTMGLNYAGYRIDPGGLNAFKKNTGNFAPGGSVAWTAADVLTLGNATWKDTRWNSQASPATANQYLNDVLCNRGYPVTVGVWRSAASTKRAPEHYVLVVGKEGNRYQIADPGRRINSKLYLDEYPRFETRGYVEPRAGFFAGFGASFAGSGAATVNRVTIAFSGNANLWIVAPDGRTTGIDPSTGNVIEDIPLSTSFEDSLSNDLTGESAGTSTQFIYVNNPKPGKYQVLIGSAQASPYELAVNSTYDDGSTGMAFKLQGNTQAGMTNTFWVPVGTTLGITRLLSAEIRVELVSDRTNALRIEASENLSNWLAVATVSVTNGVFEFTDTNAVSFNRRFYRAIGEP